MTIDELQRIADAIVIDAAVVDALAENLRQQEEQFEREARSRAVTPVAMRRGYTF